MKSLKSYLFYSLLLFATLIVISYTSYRLEHLTINNYNIPLWMWIGIHPLLFIPIGVGLAFPSFIQNLKLDGKWMIDNNKLIFLGIPALFFTFLFPIHYFTFIDLHLLVILGMKLPILSAMILGYILITSFYKYEKG